MATPSTDLPAFLAGTPPPVRKEFTRHARFQTLAPGDQLTTQGSACHFFPLVHRGVVRVYTVGENGQEITLYRIQGGEGCVLTMTCMLRSSSFPAYAVVETPCELFLIPTNVFRLWIAQFDFWREFALSYLTRTVVHVLKRMEEISFRNVDHRLVEFLLQESSGGSSMLTHTHQRIAGEIGTAREVVSRTLKEFERRGLIRLGRKSITILDAVRLREQARLL